MATGNNDSKNRALGFTFDLRFVWFLLLGYRAFKGVLKYMNWKFQCSILAGFGSRANR